MKKLLSLSFTNNFSFKKETNSFLSKKEIKSNNYHEKFANAGSKIAPIISAPLIASATNFQAIDPNSSSSKIIKNTIPPSNINHNSQLQATIEKIEQEIGNGDKNLSYDEYKKALNLISEEILYNDNFKNAPAMFYRSYARTNPESLTIRTADYPGISSDSNADLLTKQHLLFERLIKLNPSFAKQYFEEEHINLINNIALNLGKIDSNNATLEKYESNLKLIEDLNAKIAQLDPNSDADLINQYKASIASAESYNSKVNLLSLKRENMILEERNEELSLLDTLLQSKRHYIYDHPNIIASNTDYLSPKDYQEQWEHNHSAIMLEQAKLQSKIDIDRTTYLDADYLYNEFGQTTNDLRIKQDTLNAQNPTFALSYIKQKLFRIQSQIESNNSTIQNFDTQILNKEYEISASDGDTSSLLKEYDQLIASRNIIDDQNKLLIAESFELKSEIARLDSILDPITSTTDSTTYTDSTILALNGLNAGIIAGSAMILPVIGPIISGGIGLIANKLKTWFTKKKGTRFIFKKSFFKPISPKYTASATGISSAITLAVKGGLIGSIGGPAGIALGITSGFLFGLFTGTLGGFAGGWIFQKLYYKFKQK